MEEEPQVSVPNQSASFEYLITDAVLEEIKKQSTGGCLLCAIDEWAEGDWE
ncbi:MAG: hypothetical protein ACR2IV_01200 [Bryobacteraceae bacterium]